MKITLFTAEKASRLATELTPQLESMIHARAEMREVESRLDVLSLLLSGASPDNPDAAEARDLTRRRSELAEHIRNGLEAIHAQGPIVKDLEVGLLDFYSLAGDRLVFLCWKLGETEVTHWHPLDGGFPTRKPLDHSPLEE
jgi:hypothetical protein